MSSQDQTLASLLSQLALSFDDIVLGLANQCTPKYHTTKVPKHHIGKAPNQHMSIKHHNNNCFVFKMNQCLNSTNLHKHL
ncbi:unnamed protein product [Lathyrus sativus]|nr:unnamed protein product [Lathyrus sativus]